MNVSNQTKCLCGVVVLVLLILICLKTRGLIEQLETSQGYTDEQIAIIESGASVANPESRFIGLNSVGQISAGSEFNIRAQTHTQPQIGGSTEAIPDVA